MCVGSSTSEPPGVARRCSARGATPPTECRSADPTRASSLAATAPTRRASRTVAAGDTAVRARRLRRAPSRRACRSPYMAPGLYAPELSVFDDRQLELPGREALAHLSNRGAQHAALLRSGRRSQTLSCRLLLRGQPRLATLVGQQPRVPVTREDDVREHVAQRIGHGGPPPRVQCRHPITHHRPPHP